MLAIGALRSKEALNYLLERVEYGKEPQGVRRYIIMAIADVVKWIDEGTKDRVIEQLVDLIRTETDSRILHTLATALASFNDKKVLRFLELIKPKISLQDHSFIDRKIRGLSLF